MNESAEARPIATAGTGATQERVDIQVSAGEHISIPVCPMRHTPQAIRCREFVSMDIMARVLQNEPPNEKTIRGIRT